MYLLIDILRKSQMAFDFGSQKHEEERTVHAGTRRLKTGAIVQVAEHQRRTQVATAQGQPDKAPWQMTKEEYDKDNTTERDHASHVFRALQSGKPVPDEVKSQYPEYGYMTRDSKKIVQKRGRGTATKVHYHAGADIPTSDLRPGTFTTPDRATAEQFARNFGHRKIHEIHLDTSQAATGRDVIKYAKKVGIYEEGTPVGQYFERDLQGEANVQRLINYLTINGFRTATFDDGMSAHPSTVMLSKNAVGPMTKSIGAMHLLHKSNPNHEPPGGGDGEKGGQFAPRSIERDVADFEKVLWDCKLGVIDMTNPATVMRHTPKILRDLGASNRKIDIDPLDIKKIILSWTAKDGKHGIPIDIAKNIPRWISEPLMVFDSNTQPNSLVVLSEATHSGAPMYVIVQIEKRRAGRNNFVNRIASSYQRPDGDVERWVKAGLLRMYDEKKGSEWLRSRGLQLPTDGTSLQSLSRKTLLIKSQQVNYMIVKPTSQNDASKSILHPAALLKAARALHGRIDFNGLDVSVENRMGSVRHWEDPNSGESGATRMRRPYGYIKGTLGVDGDHYDVYVGPYHDASNVYIVTQMAAPDFTAVDEEKALLGFKTQTDAVKFYQQHYDDPRFLGKVTAMPFEEFKQKVMTTRDAPRLLA